MANKMMKLNTGGDEISGFWRPSESGDAIKFILIKYVPPTGKTQGQGFFLGELIEGNDKIYTKGDDDELVRVEDASPGEVVGINMWHSLQQLPEFLGHEVHLTYKGKITQKRNGRTLMTFDGEVSEQPSVKMLKLSVNSAEAEQLESLANSLNTSPMSRETKKK